MWIKVDAGCCIQGVLTLDPRLLVCLKVTIITRKRNALLSCYKRKDYAKVKE